MKNLDKQVKCVYTVYIKYIQYIRGDEMNIILSNRSDTPIYQQIASEICRNIVEGILAEGDSLPSIRFLAKELAVSVITTKKAYELLERQGYIETQPGKGSTVSAKSAGLARERKKSDMEQHLLDAIDIAKELGMSRKDVDNLLDVLYTEL